MNRVNFVWFNQTYCSAMTDTSHFYSNFFNNHQRFGFAMKFDQKNIIESKLV